MTVMVLRHSVSRTVKSLPFDISVIWRFAYDSRLIIRCVRAAGSAPSFEQMGVAIQQIISESRRDDVTDNSDYVDNESTNLSVEHQLLMTWAWINIKVGGASAADDMGLDQHQGRWNISC